MRKFRPIALITLITVLLCVSALISCTVKKEPPIPEIPDLPASEGLTLEALTDENGREYYAVTGKGECTDSTVVIPHEYNGAPVEEIADKAFYQAEGIAEVIIPGTVKRVGTLAFANAKGLEKVTLCNGVTTLCDSAFDHATDLHTVKLPQSLTHIGTFAFLDCNISEITIPDGIEYVGQDFIKYTPYYDNPENWENGLLYIDDILLSSDSKVLNGVCTVRDGTKTVASLAFAGADLKITEVVFPDSVEVLCNGVFQECFNLKKVILPDSVKRIGYNTFISCSALETVTLPAGLTEIPEGTFYYCTNLSSVNIPQGVTHIGAGAFAGCETLSELSLPEALKEICSYAFWGCSGITSVKLGVNVQKIEDNAFPSSITDIYYNGTRAQWKKIEIDKDNESITEAFIHYTDAEPPAPEIPDLPASKGLAFEIRTDENGNSYAAVTGVGDCQDRIIVIPHEYEGLTVKEIADNAFKSYRFYDEAVIPGTVERIGESAFQGCMTVKKITLCNGVKIIDKGAFFSCSNLIEIRIPSSVTYLGESALAGNLNVRSITLPDNLEYIGTGAINGTGFYNNEKNWTGDLLYMGSYLIAAKKDAAGIITVKHGTTVIASSVFSCMNNLEGVVIPDTVTALGDLVFSASPQLYEITIPDSVKTMGWGLFIDCNCLTKVTLSKNCDTVTGQMFMYCSRLNTLNIPDNVTTIEYHAFYGSGITDITLPKNLQTIGNDAFGYCTSLTNIVFNSSLKTIEYHAFSNSYNLAEINLPSGITAIGSDAFYGTAFYDNKENWEGSTLYMGEYLIKARASGDLVVKDGTTVIAGHAIGGATSVTLPDSVKYICKGAFFRCMSLKSISMTKSVVFIGAEAFEDCTALKDIYYNGSEEDWSKIVIEPLDNERFTGAQKHFQE